MLIQHPSRQYAGRMLFLYPPGKKKEETHMKILYNDGHVAECPEADELEVLRHSAAHIMAQAVKRLYPHAHFAYGPFALSPLHVPKRNVC